MRAAGRLTRLTRTGNQEVVLEPNANRTTTTWDYENQPRAYEKPTNALITMTYNADNRRVSKESAATKSNFVWDVESDNVLLETDDFNVTQATYTNEPTTFGSLISQRRNSDTNWYYFDALDSTWNLTNTSETITDSYIYDAWGNVLSSTGNTVNPFQYVGQFGYYYDTETNSNYVRARVYQPMIARWWSVDPLGFIDGLNLYAYVGNRPTNRIDPSGTRKVCCIFRNGYIIKHYPIKTIDCAKGSSARKCCEFYGGKWWRIWATETAIEGTCRQAQGPAPPWAAGYGRYCGLTRAASCNKVGKIYVPSPTNKPVDRLDKACMNHDCCLATVAKFFSPKAQAACNAKFCDAARDPKSCFASANPESCRIFAKIILASPFCIGTGGAGGLGSTGSGGGLPKPAVGGCGSGTPTRYK